MSARTPTIEPAIETQMQCELAIASSVGATATIRTTDTAINVVKGLCGRQGFELL